MAIDEKTLLENMKKRFGIDVDLSAIEEKHAKKRKEDALLEKLNSALVKLSVGETLQVEQAFAEPVAIIEEVVEEVVMEKPEAIPLGAQPLPQMPTKDIVTNSVIALAKTTRDKTVAYADSIPDSIRKELDILKKTVTDLHRYARNASQMGGGGEVNLRYLDDVNMASIDDNLFLRYNASTKLFEFVNVTNFIDWHHISTDIIPNVNCAYNLGNNTFRWDSLYVGSNSVIFSDTMGGPDQILSLANQVFYITQGYGANTQFNANAGFNAGGLISQNYSLTLANSQHDFTIGSPIDGGSIIIQRALNVGNSIANSAQSAFQVSVTGLTTIRNNLDIINPIIQTNTAPLTIQSQLGVPQGFTQPGVDIYTINSSNLSNRIVMDTYGNNMYNSIAGRASRGLINSPTALQANDVILRISGNGYDGTQFPASGTARIDLVAAENYSTVSTGSFVRFWTTAPGTNTAAVTMTMTSNATVVNGSFTANDTFINGNLIVTGNTFYANVNNIEVANLNIIVAYNSATPALANGAGLVIDSTGVTWTYNNSSNSWQTTTSIQPSAGMTYNLGSPTRYWANVYSNNTITLNTTVTSNAVLNGNTTANNLTINGNTITGNILPIANAAYDFGSASLNWKNIWADKYYIDGVYFSLVNNQIFFSNNVGLNANGQSNLAATTFSGNVLVNAYLSVNNTTLSNNVAVFSVLGSNTLSPVVFSNTGTLFYLQNQANNNNRILFDTYGNSVYGIITARTARGNISSPTALANNDVVFRITGNGFGNTFGYQGTSRIDLVATENYTDTNKGQNIQFATTKPTTNTAVVTAIIDYDGLHLGNNGAQANIHISGGSNNQILVGDGANNLNWQNFYLADGWTPTLIPTTGTINITTHSATYLKIGPQVTCQFDITVSNMNTSTGNISLGGLPFISKTASGNVGTVQVAFVTSLTDNKSNPTITGVVGANGTTATLWYQQAAGSSINVTQLPTTSIVATTRFIGSVFYTANT